MDGKRIEDFIDYVDRECSQDVAVMWLTRRLAEIKASFPSITEEQFVERRKAWEAEFRSVSRALSLAYVACAVDSVGIYQSFDQHFDCEEVVKVIREKVQKELDKF